MTATAPPKPPFYVVGDRKLLAVTSILGVIAKPALIGWASKESANAALEFVTKMWDRQSPIADSTVSAWKNAHAKNKTSAAEIGTETHAMMDSLILGDGKWKSDRLAALAGNEVADNLQKAGRNAVEKLGLKLVQPGRTVWSLANGYAGTFDALASRSDSSATFCVDYKTASGVWPEMALQVTAYAKALEEMGQPLPLRAILRLDKKTGAYEWREIKSDINADFEAFLAARRLYVWQHGDPDSKARR